MNPTKPNYAPNVVNQTVDFGGYTWKGNPGSDWTMVGQTGAPNPQQVQQQYQQGIDTAVSGLKGQQGSLGQQYQDLLGKVMSSGSQAGSLAIGQASSELAARGINPNSGYGQKALVQAETPVNAQYGQLEGQIGQGQISDYNTLASAIANLQAGGAGTAAQLPLQYQQLALQAAINPANIFATGAQGSAAQFIPIPNVGVYNMSTGQIISSTGLSSGAFNGKTIFGTY